MGILSKKGPDTIDYTYLQKKGLIKKKVEKEPLYKVNSQGMIDLTSNSNSIKPVSEPVVTQTETSPTMAQNPFGFLDNLASASANNTSLESSKPLDNPDFGAMKIKIDDLEYKLDRLVEKLSLIESKLGSFESKVFN